MWVLASAALAVHLARAAPRGGGGAEWALVDRRLPARLSLAHSLSMSVLSPPPPLGFLLFFGLLVLSAGPEPYPPAVRRRRRSPEYRMSLLQPGGCTWCRSRWASLLAICHGAAS
jgi:hypothetical protein